MTSPKISAKIATKISTKISARISTKIATKINACARQKIVLKILKMEKLRFVLEIFLKFNVKISCNNKMLEFFDWRVAELQKDVNLIELVKSFPTSG